MLLKLRGFGGVFWSIISAFCLSTSNFLPCWNFLLHFSELSQVTRQLYSIPKKGPCLLPETCKGDKTALHGLTLCVCVGVCGDDIALWANHGHLPTYMIWLKFWKSFSSKGEKWKPNFVFTCNKRRKVTCIFSSFSTNKIGTLGNSVVRWANWM